MIQSRPDHFRFSHPDHGHGRSRLPAGQFVLGVFVEPRMAFLGLSSSSAWSMGNTLSDLALADLEQAAVKPSDRRP